MIFFGLWPRIKKHGRLNHNVKRFIPTNRFFRKAHKHKCKFLVTPNDKLFHFNAEASGIYFKFGISALLIFIVTDLILTSVPFLVQVSQWIYDWVERSWSNGEPFKFALPHWLNHHPVLFWFTLQLSTALLAKVQNGEQPSLSTSDVLKGAVSWFCSWSYPRKASPAERESGRERESKSERETVIDYIFNVDCQ